MIEPHHMFRIPGRKADRFSVEKIQSWKCIHPRLIHLSILYFTDEIIRELFIAIDMENPIIGSELCRLISEMAKRGEMGMMDLYVGILKSNLQCFVFSIPCR